jgi:hypothetical protein
MLQEQAEVVVRLSALRGGVLQHLVPFGSYGFSRIRQGRRYSMPDLKADKSVCILYSGAGRSGKQVLESSIPPEVFEDQRFEG